MSIYIYNSFTVIDYGIDEPINFIIILVYYALIKVILYKLTQ